MRQQQHPPAIAVMSHQGKGSPLGLASSVAVAEGGGGGDGDELVEDTVPIVLVDEVEKAEIEVEVVVVVNSAGEPVVAVVPVVVQAPQSAVQLAPQDSSASHDPSPQNVQRFVDTVKDFFFVRQGKETRMVAPGGKDARFERERSEWR